MSAKSCICISKNDKHRFFYIFLFLCYRRVNMDTPNNGEIFLAESQGWKEEAKAVIFDVKDQVKDIKISDKLQVFQKSIKF